MAGVAVIDSIDLINIMALRIELMLAVYRAM
jgi:hypothetical protein